MNRGSPERAREPPVPRHGFNEAPIHESGKSILLRSRFRSSS